jgi:hypothetical protein
VNQRPMGIMDVVHLQINNKFSEILLFFYIAVFLQLHKA